MNTRNFLVLSGVLAALLIPSQLPAAAPSHQCSQLWDDALRLSCYDTAFGKPRPPAETAAVEVPAAPAAPAAAAAPAVAVAPAVPAPVSAAPVAAAAAAPVVVASAAPAAPAPAVATATPPQPAGKEKEKGKTAEPVKAVVTAVGQTLDGRFRATLENGQVWQQIEIDTQVRVKVGDQVTVRNASLGSRQLVLPGGMVVRVTQVK